MGGFGAILTAGALSGPGVGLLGRSLIGLGLASAPAAMPVIADILEGMTPGQRLTLGRAEAIGVSAITKLGENGVVGNMRNGAALSVGFENAAGNLGVNISNIETAVKGSINFRGLESGAGKLAQAEGASSVTITAVNVRDAKLAQTLTKAGYAAKTITDKFGRETVNYSKTIKVTPQN